VAERLLVGLAAYPLADLPVKILPSLLVVEGRARAAARFGLVQAAARGAGFVLPVALGWSLPAMLASVNVFGFAVTGLLVFYLRGLYRGAARVRSPISTGTLVRFGVPLGLTEIVSKLNESVDRYLILFLYSTELFGLYSAGCFQISVVTAIAYAVGAAFSPQLARLFGARRGAEAVALWGLTIRKVALAVVPLALVFVVAAEECMVLWSGPDYRGSAGVFRYYSLVTMGRVAAFGVVMVAAGQPRYVLYASGVTLVANLVFSVPLAVVMGLEGPALGAALAFVAMVVAYCTGIGRAAGVPLRRVFPLRAYLGVVAVGAVACLPALAFKARSPFGEGGTLAVVAALVLGCFAFLGSTVGLITRADWSFVLGLFGRRTDAPARAPEREGA
jgi:O-antigen/teichoic acid export membrane protein